MIRSILLLPIFIFCFALFCEASFSQEQAASPLPATEPADQSDVDEADDESETIIDTKVTTEIQTLGDHFIRFHMWDGAIVGGNVSIDQLSVKTEFGNLLVPIHRISSFYPGLDSFPERDDRIQQLIEDLGDRDYSVREKSHRSLLAMSLQLRDQITNANDGGSAERKKHLLEIRKEIEERLDSASEEDEKIERAMIRRDLINTPDFSIAGKIQQPAFEISSRYGKLTIKLADIRFADRSFNQPQTDVRKTVTVAGSTFFQKQPKSSGIRINKGDRISINASGSVNWTNWNNTASPDGLTNQGQWKGMNCGTLAARIGKDGDILKIGSKNKFVAKRSGVLYLAIAIKDNYAKNEGYRWEGDFKAKVVVTPKPE